jgi:hypothetical protein
VTREQLEHAIRAACDVSEDYEVWVFGSQAILGSHPNAPESLRASIEVDMQPKNRPQMVDEIDGALGEMSQFHQTFGFYVHGVSIETATLPHDWELRVVCVSHPTSTRGNSGLCLEPHDLAASKLAAFRDKDREFVRNMLAEGLVSGDVLLQRVDALPLPDERLSRLTQWVRITVEDLVLGH